MAKVVSPVHNAPAATTLAASAASLVDTCTAATLPMDAQPSGHTICRRHTCRHRITANSRCAMPLLHLLRCWKQRLLRATRAKEDAQRAERPCKCCCCPAKAVPSAVHASPHEQLTRICCGGSESQAVQAISLLTAATAAPQATIR